MEKNFMDANALIELEFLMNKKSYSHFHENIELLYILNGSLKITIEEETFCMGLEDIIVINANKKHSYQGSDDVFIGRFTISYAKTSELLEQNLILFWCNSVVDKNEAYDELRTIIPQIFNQHLETRAEGRIYMKSLYYQMLHILTSNFLLTAKDIRFETEKDKFDDRMNKIIHYIRSNYNRESNLQDLADKLFLSTAYLSKYIKKKCDASFIELINSVRLNHAMEDLIHTNASIMKIAMDNGFASVAAFNKVFKNLYTTTPSEFRKSTKGKETEVDEIKEETKIQLIQEKVGAYLGKKPVLQQAPHDRKEEHIIVDTKSGPSRLWNKNWNRMINAGSASDLSRSVFREHILYLKEKLHFEYVRFWDIYSPDMLLDIHASGDMINFGRLDCILDFLISNNMKPYIELGFKPLRLLKNAQDALVEIPREEDFNSLEEMENFYYEMMAHMLDRYGAEEVETWYFELWKREDLVFLQLSYNYKPLSEKENVEYFEKFDAVAGGIKRCLPSAHMGGGGFCLQHYGHKGFLDVLETWKRYKYQPDFISLNCYPYKLEKDGNTYFEKKSTDMHFVKNNLDTAKEVIRESGIKLPEIHVSEYNLTLSNRNVINDCCGKGAFLMQTFIECIDCADMMGYWLGSDMYADFHDTKKILFGGVGLLNKTGIPKPAFYAFDFMNRMYKTLLSKGNNYIITHNGNHSWKIACHNFKKFNYNYYLTSEDKIKVSDLPLMLEDKNSLNLHIKLNYVKNGSYTVRTYAINQNYGSLQDEWVRLSMESDLNMEELDFIKRICTPRLSMKKYTVEKNCLDLEIILEPNEMQYLHISFR